MMQSDAELVGWQPIETAPVGRNVLLYCPDLGVPSNPERIELDMADNGRGSHHSWATLWHPLPALPHALAQSDAELVAWRFRWGDEPWKYTDDEESALRINKGFNYTVEPLYRSGAKSDASAGLIEAATQARNILEGLPNLKGDAFTAWRILTDALRAADRSQL